FVGSVLAYGCQGKAVHALREKLKKLDCYPSNQEDDSEPETVFYDRSIEAAVTQFQQQQKLPITGIASSVTLAKIAALSTIADLAKRPVYLRSGDVGVGVVSLQQKLLTLQKQGELQFNPIHQDEISGGRFEATTRDAVIAFQKRVFADATDWDGVVGAMTGGELQKHFDSRLTNLLTAPIAPIYFQVIKDVFREVLHQAHPKEDLQRMKSQSDIDPLIDTIAQLLPFLPEYNHDKIYGLLKQPNTIAKTELHRAVTKAYGLLQSLVEEPLEKPLFDRLKHIAEELQRRFWRGYFCSRVLDTFTYRMGDKNTDQGAAIIYLQERLSNLGFYKAPITGYFEELTDAAVRAFQEKYSLQQDGKVGSRTREKLFALDEETVRPLEAQIPDLFLQVVAKAINIPQEDLDLKPLVILLMQMVMPIAKQIDLEAAIKDQLATCQAIAQYCLIQHCLIQQVAEQRWKPEERDRKLKHWWKLFQTGTQSKSSRRLLQVCRNHELRDRFESAIVDFIRELPKNSEIIEKFYGSL
ncbi:peptidoglycan-binding protein, partial [Pseudanabaenaceae cyanobacterium LEGE 13415]|nr:peptidoglycan-binding protein [Pseudanabaenaceae cyanobacterium LEGE 13415]